MIEVNRRLYMDEGTGSRGPSSLDIKTLLERVITSDMPNTLRTDLRLSDLR